MLEEMNPRTASLMEAAKELLHISKILRNRIASSGSELSRVPLQHFFMATPFNFQNPCYTSNEPRKPRSQWVKLMMEAFIHFRIILHPLY